jgi:hypothetical protein
MTSKIVDHIRAMPDEVLGGLLQRRPDVVVPVPANTSVLASRLQSRVSVARALDRLDQFCLEVLDGLRLARDSSGAARVDVLLAWAAESGVAAGRVQAAIDTLRELVLIYGDETRVRLVGAIDELTSLYPADLGRPAAELDHDAADLVADPAGLRRALLSAPPEARAVLDRLAAGPPVGSVQPAVLRSRPGEMDSPVRWLVERHLLVPIAADMVELPREVGILLRRDTGPLGGLHPDPPEIEAGVPPGVDSAGAGQALEAVRHVEALLQALADDPAPVLRTTGLGIRDLRRYAKATGLTEVVTVVLLEVAYAAGLVSHTERYIDPQQLWLPTPAYDQWRRASLPHRWALLARTWLTMTRAPALVGTRADDRDRPISALSFDATSLAAAKIRRQALAVLLSLPDGGAADPDAVIGHLVWQSPRQLGRVGTHGDTRVFARAALVEAGVLGITGFDAMTSYGRLLLTEHPRDPDTDPLGIKGVPNDPLLATLAGLLPEPVEHVLVQADLTVVVPGPPEPDLAGELALIADAESRGGATVYRVTPQSVRRALDAGHPASDIHAMFTRRSRTPLPQTLRYLIDDVARRHGGLRAGTLGAYLRGDDETLITEVLSDKRLRPLGLRRLAPTVLATAHSTTRLLDALREAGYAPMPEDANGVAVLNRPASPRGPIAQPPMVARPDDFVPPSLHGPRLASVIEQIRMGDRVSKISRESQVRRELLDADGLPMPPSQAHTQALAVLQQAMRDQARVWVGYVDAQGGAASKLVRPVSMAMGYLRAEDDRTETLHTFALHRITSAVRDQP